MNGNHQSIDFRPHPYRPVWLHRTFEDTLPQPVDAVREDFMERDAVTFDDQIDRPLTLEQAQYIGATVIFGLCVLALSLVFAAYAMWPLLRALW